MEIVYFEGQTAITLLRVCKFKSHLIDKKILNKFFYRTPEIQI
jgi:hypothetical protein